MKVVDLYCDLLSYYLNSSNHNDDNLGCSLHFLKGNVSIQTLAIYTATAEGSTKLGIKQSEIFRNLADEGKIVPIKSENFLTLDSEQIGAVCAIENASSFCEENEDLETGFVNLEKIISNVGSVLYIGLTHHLENRFGGGNSSNIGLKEDGKILIDYLSSKNIATDLSHTSDELAFDILNYIDQKNYNLKIIASHSNSRVIQPNPRNLPDELIMEIIQRKGLIGMNFIKDYIDLVNPEKIFNHIDYILNLGGKNCLAYGADFFYDKAHPDKSRYSFFYEGYNNAEMYNSVNERLTSLFGKEITENISYKNTFNFIKNLWKK